MPKNQIDFRQCMYCGGKFSLGDFNGICPNCLVELSGNEILGANDLPIYAVLYKKGFNQPVGNTDLLCRKCKRPFAAWEDFSSPQNVFCQDCAPEERVAMKSRWW
jgi:predicted amidophosphoribosyltransferase